MKKILALALAAVAAASLAAPASAAKKAKPLTMYLHGTHHVGEAGLPDGWLNDVLMEMDTTKPAAGAPKSMFVTNGLVTPNDECSGNGLLPVWRGELKTNFKGTVKVTLHTVATPGNKISVELFADPTGGCNSEIAGASDFVPPVAEAAVEFAPGHATTDVVFKNVKFKTQGSLALQLHAVPAVEDPQQVFQPGQVRVLYDSADFASSVSLIPGK